MISWIVATHDRDMLERNLLKTLTLVEEDELIIVNDAPSIACAYAEGQEQAKQATCCYIHHDVQILDIVTLRQRVLGAVAIPKTGMVGVVGSRSMLVPWWNGDPLGSVMDSRLGRISFAGAGECAVLDGLFLATRKEVDWDLDWPGWHGYDYDSCMQMKQRGLVNWCIPQGSDLLFHNSDSPLSLHEIDGWQTAAVRFSEKWG